MNRRKFIEKMIITGAIPTTFGCNKIDIVPPWHCDNLLSEISVQPKLIINSDMHDAYISNNLDLPINEDDYLDRRMREMTSHANYIFYSTGTTHIFTHRTKVGERRVNSFIENLESQNTDPLAVAANYVKSQGKKLFFSLRMNDTHDSTNENLFTEWKESNRSALVGSEGVTYKYGNNRWSAMDYEHEETRKYILDLIEEAIYNYKLDGIEMDFMRHPILFRSQLFGVPANARQINLMNELIADISMMCKKARIKLATRVPDSTAYNLVLGIDLESWLKAGMIDILSLGGYFHLSKWCSLATMKDIGNFEMYACLSRDRLRNYETKRILPDYNWLNEAFAAIRGKLDGIYLFNVVDRDAGIYQLFDKNSLNDHANIHYSEIKGLSANYWIKDGQRYYNY